MSLEIPYRDGMKVGKGFDLLMGEARPSPAVEGRVTGVAGAGGQHVESHCRTVEDVATLHEQLDVGVSVSASYALLSADAKVKFVNTCDFSSFSTYVIVVVKVTNVLRSFDDPRFTEDARELLVNNNRERFRERFGDCFIHGIKTGGDFFAIYQLQSTLAEERSSLAIDVNAAFDGLITSAELAVRIRTAKQESKSHLDVRVHLSRAGTISTAPNEANDIMKAARNFPPLVAGDKGYAYSVLLEKYRTLRSPNDAFNFIEIAHQQEVLADYAQRRFEFLELRDDLAYAKTHPGDFVIDGRPIDMTKLREDYIEVTDIINSLQEEMVACSRDATQCSYTSSSASDYARPELKPYVAPPPPPHNPMPEFSGRCFLAVQMLVGALQSNPTVSVEKFIAGINEELRYPHGVDWGPDPLALGGFLQQAIREGVTFTFRGSFAGSVTKITNQSPRPGVSMVRGAKVMLSCE